MYAALLMAEGRGEGPDTNRQTDTFMIIDNLTKSLLYVWRTEGGLEVLLVGEDEERDVLVVLKYHHDHHLHAHHHHQGLHHHHHHHHYHHHHYHHLVLHRSPELHLGLVQLLGLRAVHHEDDAVSAPAEQFELV